MMVINGFKCPVMETHRVFETKLAAKDAAVHRVACRIFPSTKPENDNEEKGERRVGTCFRASQRAIELAPKASFVKVL